MERALRSKLLRIVLALALLATSGWVFLPYLLHRVSSSAFVNAELMRVTAPFGGQLSPELPRKGEFLREARAIELLRAVSPDRRHLVELEQRYALALEAMKLAQRQLAEIDAADERLAEQARHYQQATTDRLTLEAEQAKAEEASCQAQEQQLRGARSRSESLAQSGFTTQGRLEEVQASHKATGARCRAAAARVREIEVRLKAAENGVFVQDGSNDVPYSQQQRDRLMLRRQELQAEAVREKSRLAQLAAEVEEERTRVQRLSHFAAQLPAHHIVWSVAASPNSAVVEGQPILDLADCRNRFVAVQLPERDFEQVRPGDPAQVRLVGSEKWLTSRVGQIRGSAAYSNERLLAARIAEATSRSITVEVALPPGSDDDGDSSYCSIGRLAEVRFDRLGESLLVEAARLLGASKAMAGTLFKQLSILGSARAE
jgi:multidrug resistance efflux pump